MGCAAVWVVGPWLGSTPQHHLLCCGDGLCTANHGGRNYVASIRSMLQVRCKGLAQALSAAAHWKCTPKAPTRSAQAPTSAPLAPPYTVQLRRVAWEPLARWMP